MKTLTESILGSMGMGDKKIYSDSFAIHAVIYFLNFYKNNGIELENVLAYEGRTGRDNSIPYLTLSLNFNSNTDRSLVSPVETQKLWKEFINKESPEAKKRTEISAGFDKQFRVTFKSEEYFKKLGSERFQIEARSESDCINFDIPMSEWIKYRNSVKSYVKKLGFKYEEDKVK